MLPEIYNHRFVYIIIIIYYYHRNQSKKSDHIKTS